VFENELTEVFNDILKQQQQHQQHQPDMLYVNVWVYWHFIPRVRCT